MLTIVVCILVLLALLFATRIWEADNPPRLVFYFISAAVGISYVGWREKERASAQRTADLHMRTVEALAVAIEAIQHSPDDHLQRVRVYALELGRKMKLPQDQMEALRTAALLHNIGKLAVPEHLSTKPGQLTREETARTRVHSVVGAAILESVQFPYPVVPIVRSLHERWDGAGYPDGLKGEQIPVGARILSAVESLASMVSGRQGQPSMAIEAALERLGLQSGQAFDPQVVDLLHKHGRELEKLAAAQAVKTRRTAGQPEKSETALAVLNGAGTQQPNFLTSISAARMEAETLFEMSSDLGSSLNLDETLSVLSVRLRRLVPFSSIAAYVIRDQELAPEYVSGDNFRLLASLRIPLDKGISGWVASNRRPIVNGDPCMEPGYVNDSKRFSALRSAISIPLEGLEGVVGALTLYHCDENVYTDDHLRILQTISSKVALSVENALAFRRAESSATTDYLTNLPNARALFMHLDRELARCKRLNASITVMVCDLDGFKEINDRFGHLEGNRILRIFARSLQESCREYDYVARMGGDEFVIVAPGMADAAAQARAASLDQLARAAGREVCSESLLSLSVGYAICPDDGSDAEKLLAEADRRMYIEKQRRRGGDFASDAAPAVSHHPVV
jgi:diguanylate cyclase (GGDEF)-like protein/putative nucleotidyltransferase with HDIG domain